MKHSALIFLVIITILATTFASNSADQQNSCPTKKCNRRRKIACSKPPNGEDSCPIIKCKNKFYKSKITGKTCAKKCPLYCNDAGTKKCKGPYNKRGCYTGDICIPRQPGCKKSFCPLYCPSGEQECPSGYFDDGCPKGPKCVPEFEQNGCPVHCPIFCGPGFIECPGLLGPDGCPLAPTCKPELDPVTNTTNTCDICPKSTLLANGSCPYMERPCANSVPPGCPQTYSCFPLFDSNNCRQGCPETCPGDTISCLFPAYPGLPCLSYTNCLPKLDALGCPQECLFSCNRNEKRCARPIAENPTCWEDFCYPATDENGCQQSCPHGCKPDEKECPYSPQGSCPSFSRCWQKYDSDGCESECSTSCYNGDNICRRFKNDTSICTENYCHPSTVVDGCPEPCPDLPCKPDEQICAKKNYVEGCPDIQICAYKGTDDCPQPCPLNCEVGQQICHKQTDENPNCFQPFCAPSMDENGCPVPCPNLTCSPLQQKCPVKSTVEGCPAIETCYSKGTDTCPLLCPLQCDQDQQICYEKKNEDFSCSQPFCFPKVNENGCQLSCPNVTCLTTFEIACTVPEQNGCPAFEYCANKLGNGCYL